MAELELALLSWPAEKEGQRWSSGGAQPYRQVAGGHPAPQGSHHKLQPQRSQARTEQPGDSGHIRHRLVKPLMRRLVHSEAGSWGLQGRAGSAQHSPNASIAFTVLWKHSCCVSQPAGHHSSQNPNLINIWVN